ncbi:ABC transporter permease [Clostridium sp. UBA871]|uniref:ABC transporter permease n=1 Tax=Clostridium sp. UBA871 TaxID=1946380 RepID=UPI0032180CD6
MKSFWGIIPRYIKKGKKRIIFVALGIIVSMALIVSLGTISEALKESLYQKMKDDSGGIHDIYLGTLGYVDFDRVAKEEVVKEVTTVWPIGRYDVPNTDNSLQISAFKENATDILNLELIEGRYPEKDNEIAIEKWILDLFPKKYEIGDKIIIPYTIVHRGRGTEFYYEKGETEFVLTGTYDFTYRNWFYPKEGNAYITPEFGEKILKEKKLTMQSVEADGYIMIKPSYSVEDAVKKLTESRYSTGGFFANEPKLQLKSEYEKYDNIMFFVSLILIVISSVIVYNIFNVSVSERTKEFGMLRAMGCPPWKIKAMILIEGMLITIVFIPIGILLGNWITRYIIKIVTGIENLGTVRTMDTKIILVAIVVGLLTAFIGTYFPARKASVISPTEAITGGANTSLKSSNMRGSLDKSILKKVSFEINLAFINIIRNKKRFLSTCLSLIITITMFMTVNYVVGSTNPVAIFKDSFKVDFKVDSKSGLSLEKVSSVEGLDVTLKLKRRGTTMDIEKENYTEEGLRTYEELGKSVQYISQCISRDRYLIEVTILGRSDEELEALKKNVIAGEIDIDKMKNEDILILVQNIDGLNYTNLSVGDVVQPSFTKLNDNGEFLGGTYPEFKVGAIVSEDAIKGLPLGTPSTTVHSSAIILPDSAMKKHMEMTKYQYWEGNVKEGYDYEEVEEELRAVVDGDKGATLLSYREELEKVKVNNAQIIFAMYSIVIVVAIVSIINLINIMNMSAIMRKKEFGFLRAMGLSGKQVKKIIMWEGAIYGIVSSAISVLLTLGISAIITKNSELWLGQIISWHIPIGQMTIIIIITIIITLLSSILPSKILFKSSIVESIRDVE